MSDTPTPRVGEQIVYLLDDTMNEVESVPAEFARQLERELADALEQVAILRSDEKRLAEFTKVYRLRADEADDKLDAERALADRLAGELQWWGDYCGDNAPASIDLTLAAWKEARRE
jgi:hypothetical protein